jgi:Fe-S cluster assembly iron-binding protein IscA
MALDEPNDADQQFDVDGFQFVVNKDFFNRAKPIKIDFHMYGFKLDSGLQINAGDGCACSTDQKSKCGC